MIEKNFLRVVEHMMMMYDVEWLSPKALLSLHCSCKYRCTIHPHIPKRTKMWKKQPRRQKKERNPRKKLLEKSGA